MIEEFVWLASEAVTACYHSTRPLFLILFGVLSLEKAWNFIYNFVKINGVPDPELESRNYIYNTKPGNLLAYLLFLLVTTILRDLNYLKKKKLSVESFEMLNGRSTLTDVMTKHACARTCSHTLVSVTLASLGISGISIC